MLKDDIWYAVYLAEEVVPSALFRLDNEANDYAKFRVSAQPGIRAKIVPVKVGRGDESGSNGSRLWLTASGIPWNPWG